MLPHMSKIASFINIYLVQIYIGLLESFLQIPVLTFHFVVFHVLCHKLLNNSSRLFGNNFCLNIDVCRLLLMPGWHTASATASNHEGVVCTTLSV